MRGKAIQKRFVDNRGNHITSLPHWGKQHSGFHLSSATNDFKVFRCAKKDASNEEKGKGIYIRQDEEEHRGILLSDF